MRRLSMVSRGSDEHYVVDMKGWQARVSKSKKLKPVRKQTSSQRTDGLVNHGTDMQAEMKVKPSYKEKLRENQSKGAFVLKMAKRELNEVGKCRGYLAPIELVVDSGAADTVTPPGSLEKIEADKTNADDVGFVVAD